jgi:hypothetical protein
VRVCASPYCEVGTPHTPHPFVCFATPPTTPPPSLPQSPLLLSPTHSTSPLIFCSGSMEMLRHIRDFFGSMFKIAEEESTGTVLLQCLGMGYKNLAKKVT